ncbi:DUF4405 domain-containing protein [Methylomonas sp. SURF-2]|uniref:DUF4405 domain-containing protein n=1 Tax=Methylomonas subterranea TaxID=2952225 RepID=A0ABT1TEK2_9GAMM|nr:DUF4405 domain-containing protein [Methylomonas sp. SURF-2]MCQ8103880.1 DUF4405 domain-containing protein [Methylomonas sp. SURF-2]
MNKTLVNILIDLLAALLFLGMIATGYLLRFPLPPGSNKTLALWGFSRHQWGDIHFWISLGLLLVLLIHMALHWNWIVTVIGKRCHRVKTTQPSLSRSGIGTLCVFTVLFVLFGWLAQRDVKTLTDSCCPTAAGGDQIATRNHDVSADQASQQPAKALVWDDIYPIFAANCLDCHGPRQRLADFRVDSREDFFKNAERPALVWPGQSGQSPLIAIISGARTDMPMANSHRLADAEVSRIAAWIDQGAK